MNPKRRRFLTGAAAVAACTVAFPFLADHSALSGHMDCDVCVVGAGGAGLSAAVSALQHGLSVILIEKLTSIGGNTLRSVGMYNAAGIGASNTAEALDNQTAITLASGEGRNDPQLVRTFVKERLKTLDWLQSLGIRFFSRSFSSWGGEEMEGVKPVLARGQSYIQALASHFRSLGGELMLSTTLESLVPNGNGGVSGLLARKANQQADHPPFFIHCRKGIVLATGGFAANPQLLSLWAPGYERFPTDNSIGSTGDGIVAAQGIGAVLTNLDSVQTMPGAPSGRDYEVRLDHDVGRFILLDDQGNRFVNEDDSRRRLTQIILQRANHRLFSISDEAAVQSFDPLTRKGIMRGLLGGDAFRAATVTELARQIDVAPQALVHAVHSFNEEVRQHTGKCARIACEPIAHPPFWAAPVFLNVHSTLGGVAVTPQAQVLRSGKIPIAGLFAAGEIVGNLHGRNRIGGNGLAGAFTLGRLAGIALSA